VIGTLDFMPPEQREGAQLTDHRSDLWSLAATFYQMLTGEPPRVIDLDSIPSDLRPVLARALKSRKEDRFQTALEMREAILQAHSGKKDTSRTLGEGECPDCGVLNPPDRKFCRECTAKLQVSCLKCQVPIPIWDKGCGECGSLQQPLVEVMREELKTFHDQAELHLQKLEFDKAVKVASKAVGPEDPRLQTFSTWHEEFLSRLEHRHTTEYQRLNDVLQEALELENACEFETALKLLENVPVAFSKEEMTIGIHLNSQSGETVSAHELVHRVTAKISELKSLELSIKQCVKDKQFNGLVPSIDRFLLLSPQNKPFLHLKKGILEREKVEAEVHLCVESNQFSNAIALLDTLSEILWDKKLRKLRTQIEAANSFQTNYEQVKQEAEALLLEGNYAAAKDAAQRLANKSTHLNTDYDSWIQIFERRLDDEAFNASFKTIRVQAEDLFRAEDYTRALQLVDSIRPPTGTAQLALYDSWQPEFRKQCINSRFKHSLVNIGARAINSARTDLDNALRLLLKAKPHENELLNIYLEWLSQIVPNLFNIASLSMYEQTHLEIAMSISKYQFRDALEITLLLTSIPETFRNRAKSIYLSTHRHETVLPGWFVQILDDLNLRLKIQDLGMQEVGEFDGCYIGLVARMATKARECVQKQSECCELLQQQEFEEILESVFLLENLEAVIETFCLIYNELTKSLFSLNQESVVEPVYDASVDRKDQFQELIYKTRVANDIGFFRDSPRSSELMRTLTQIRKYLRRDDYVNASLLLNEVPTIFFNYNRGNDGYHANHLADMIVDAYQNNRYRHKFRKARLNNYNLAAFVFTISVLSIPIFSTLLLRIEFLAKVGLLGVYIPIAFSPVYLWWRLIRRKMKFKDSFLTAMTRLKTIQNQTSIWLAK